MTSEFKARVAGAGEELANAVTHGLGLALSLAAVPVLVLLAARSGDSWAVVGASVFGACLVTLYAASTIYHALPAGPAKSMWRRIDHAAIYLLIAGTYTPFSLGPLRGPWGWSLLAIAWGAAALGILVKVFAGPGLPFLSNLTYLGLGWLPVVAAGPLLKYVGWGGFAWLLAGGLAYTFGVIFYACDRRLRYGHCMWHLFVLAGSICHGVAVARYATGYEA